jgi:hypothetical protein
MGISAVFPKDLLGFWLVQPFATIQEKALFWSLSVLQSGPWLTCKTSPEGLEMAFNFPCPVSAAAS